MGRTSESTALARLGGELADAAALEPLAPVEYAAGHALFEARSDQRANLTRWLVQHLGPRATRPNRVLSIGCGDGSVDVRVAAALMALGHRVDYVGVEPHAPSGELFRTRLSSVAGVHPTLLTSPFDRARPQGRYDVVLAVHSLYYVDDLATTLRRACALLAPGGELMILHAPLEPLNTLVRLLAPGRPQAFSGEVADLLREQLRAPALTCLENRLDLTETGSARTDRRLLDFTVQARVPAGLRDAVRAALAEMALPGPGVVVPHPVDALVVRA